MIKDYYTIKEYAEIKGCSSQYVYRIAHTKLKPFIIEVEGKMCIKREALEEDFNQSTNKETNRSRWPVFFCLNIIKQKSPS